MLAKDSWTAKNSYCTINEGNKELIGKNYNKDNNILIVSTDIEHLLVQGVF